MKLKPGWGIAVLFVAGAIGAAVWWLGSQRDPWPAYVVHSNGRMEIGRLDVAVKYPGRVIDLPVREGDALAAGAVVARQDDAELLAQLSLATAARERAVQAASRAQAEIGGRESRQRLARLELTEAVKLYQDRQISSVERDRRQLGLDGESAGVTGARAALGEANAAIAEADAQIARLKILQDEATIRAPVAGRVEYRVIEVGTVLPAGGRVVSLLNLADMYFTVFLPAGAAGKLAIGDEARIVLDAMKDEPIPARVSFVASEAQFTPKYVETDAERAKLMYRVKLQLAPEVAQRYAAKLKAGMTGDGFVRLDARQPWPAALTLPRQPA
ncbi:HlyD family secretion protein [Cupriavidus basilensis]|uniref:HlyD family secretion protein n=1 Tax=Cupriavidus basilensis TaxID=68895 RepID=UPI0020A681A9|nr:HlyD family efflux transporter periplasmic adaptor subunit [Cupriavidus basilensis]MCP3017772.1 HlyD family efflux transporter periplasmic adaptor subunit [Cupriavidus basilensis]MDR3380107.1 HlyD family efflux transporter periplasmic adaptor subunit [Cupriavidus basilensis]